MLQQKCNDKLTLLSWFSIVDMIDEELKKDPCRIFLRGFACHETYISHKDILLVTTIDEDLFKWWGWCKTVIFWEVVAAFFLGGDGWPLCLKKCDVIKRCSSALRQWYMHSKREKMSSCLHIMYLFRYNSYCKKFTSYEHTKEEKFCQWVN